MAISFEPTPEALLRANDLALLWVSVAKSNGYPAEVGVAAAAMLIQADIATHAHLLKDVTKRADDLRDFIVKGIREEWARAQ